MSKTIKILHICNHDLNEEEITREDVNLVKQNRGFIDTTESIEADIWARKCALTNIDPIEKIKISKVYGDTLIVDSINGTSLLNPRIVSVGEEIVVDELNINNSTVVREDKIIIKSFDISGGTVGNADDTAEILITAVDNNLGVAPLMSFDLSLGMYKVADYIDFDKMSLYRHIKKKILSGAESELWFYQTTSSFADSGYTRFYIEVNDAMPAPDQEGVYCMNNMASIYKSMSKAEMLEMTNDGIAMNDVDGGILISVRNDNYTTDASADSESEAINKLKTYLQGNNISIYYQLEDPTVFDIRNIPIKTELSHSGTEMVKAESYVLPILDLSYMKIKSISIVDEADYDIIDIGIINSINEVKQGDIIYSANLDYELFTHNKIRWIGKSKPSVGTVYTVDYNKLTRQSTAYLIDNCPKCNGNGWYIDIIENNNFSNVAGVDKMTQDFMKVLLSKKKGNVGTDMVTLSGREFYGTDEVETRILTAIKEAEDQYKLMQVELLSSGTPLPNDEKLYRININNIEYDDITLKAMVSITLYNYENQKTELNLEI